MSEVPLYLAHQEARPLEPCRGTSLIRNTTPVGPYSTPLIAALCLETYGGPQGVGVSCERGTTELYADTCREHSRKK